VKSFSQQAVDALVAKERAKGEEKLAALQSEIEAARRADAVTVLKEAGVELRDDETPEAAVERHFSDLSADHDVRHQAELQRIQSEHDPVSLTARAKAAEAKLFDLSIDGEIRRAAPDAFNVEQITAIVKSHCHELGNGELVVADLVPTALQSVGEAVDYLRTTAPNLFIGSDGRPGQ